MWVGRNEFRLHSPKYASLTRLLSYLNMKDNEQKGYKDNSGFEIKFLGKGYEFLINEETLGKVLEQENEYVELEVLVRH